MALAALLAVVGAIVVVVDKVSHSGTSTAAHTRHARARKVPPYYTVRPGDTLTGIARRTRVSIASLEAYNPKIDPQSLAPGQRLNLWRHPPTHHRKPLGPRFWTVRSGESYGSIAAKTRISIVKLEALNPRLKPSALQPGDRMRLR